MLHPKRRINFPPCVALPQTRSTANRETAVGSLETAASTLHEKAGSLPGGERVAGIAHSTADKLSATADYVREHDVNGMMADVERLVKINPGPALVAAAFLGFLVARAFSSRD
jgi:hypothetical protein